MIIYFKIKEVFLLCKSIILVIAILNAAKTLGAKLFTYNFFGEGFLVQKSAVSPTQFQFNSISSDKVGRDRHLVELTSHLLVLWKFVLHHQCHIWEIQMVPSWKKKKCWNIYKCYEDFKCKMLTSCECDISSFTNSAEIHHYCTWNPYIFCTDGNSLFSICF